ncbi:hypothetical protein O181_054307 [Austropuccinia psidii MF-1]|uniref:histone acetyltransferase n=1 Tax=Austropuccinia psidii MF-1 TaxID=1389203 RepID=A0A9Q3EBG7_9BASI|nr:hypothetical protein [Austropuccinia psidii MF-1]
MAGSNLHLHLLLSLQSLKTTDQSPRNFNLTTLKSTAYRTHTLFPHATDPTAQVFRTDYLVVLAEKFSSNQNHHIVLPVFALEASLYSLHSASIGLLYISKIDTTGLAPLPAPSGLLTIAFINYFLLHPQKSCQNLRIHIFARAAREGQYLFPGSAENVLGGSGDGAPQNFENHKFGKRILDDQQLIKWWHKILSKILIQFNQSNQKHLLGFYILPGFDQDESRDILPIPPNLKSLWNYGHPYHSIPSIFSSGHPSDPISDLIPAFADDPKARFLHSLANSSTNPAGEPGDWDDAINERSTVALEADRARERSRMNHVSVNEFWERMGGRQECCDGRVSAFFVLFTPSTNPQNSNSGENQKSNHQINGLNSRNLSSGLSDEPRMRLIGVPRNVWVSLWSKIHNQDYSKSDAAAKGYCQWIEDLQACFNSIISGLKSNPTPTDADTFTALHQKETFCFHSSI